MGEIEIKMIMYDRNPTHTKCFRILMWNKAFYEILFAY